MRNVYVVSDLSGVIITCSTYAKALAWVEQFPNSKFRIHEYEVDTENERLLYMTGATEAQCAQITSMTSRRYVKTPPGMYAKAVRHILKSNPELTLQVLAERIDKSVDWLEEILRNNPEPHISAAEVLKDEAVSTDRPVIRDCIDYSCSGEEA